MLKEIIGNGFVYSYTIVLVSVFLAITFVGLAFLGTMLYYLIV